jgi:isopenicillin-N epimerase
MGNALCHWDLSPDILHLNHGSYGACPKKILAVQRAIQNQVDRDPDLFYITEAEDQLAHARSQLARHLGADPDDVVWVKNATAGVNAVLRSLPFKAGDRIVTTDHIYNACRNVLNYVCERTGAVVEQVPLPFPCSDSGQIVEAVLGAAREGTQLVMLDHIASASALVFPIKEIITELNHRGIDSLIDGAHAPGQIPLNLAELGATYYTGNCHKWLFAPRSAAFLMVAPERQQLIQPVIISHGSNARSERYSDFQLRFKWPGTDDLSSLLTVPSALDFPSELLAGKWDQHMKRNHLLARDARALINDAFGGSANSPDEMMGSMATISLPARITRAIERLPLSIELPAERHFRKSLISDSRWRLWQHLYYKERIDTMFTPVGTSNALYVRISAQAYNELDDYQRLATALTGLI